MSAFSNELDKKIKLLDETHSWPGKYLFKFIVPEESKSELLSRMGSHELVVERPSRTGKYISLTIEKSFDSSHEVIEQYQSVRHISGLISL